MKTILVVEDDKDIAKALHIRLSSAGYNVDHAFDVYAARQKIVKTKFDLMVLDITMPAGDGFDVAQFSIDNVKSFGTPFIFITASKDVKYKEKSDKLGALAYFEKPYDAAEMIKVIDAKLK